MSDDPIAEQAREILDREWSEDTFTIRPADLSELLTTELKPVEYLHKPHVPAGRRIWAFGAAAAGKSLWAMWVAAQVSRDGRRVLFVSEENPLDEDIRRLKRLAPDPAHFAYVYGSGLDLTKGDHITALLEAAEGAELVVLDTLTAVWTGDEGDNAAIATLDRDVLLPLIHAGATVIVLDHTGHPQAFVKRGGVNAGRGASSKGQKADVVLNFISKGHGEFVVDASAKFRVGDGRGPGEMLLRVLDTEPLDIEMTADAHALKVKELAESIVDAVTEAGELTTNKLRAAIGGKKELQDEAMKLLDGEDPRRVTVTPGKNRSKLWRPSGQIIPGSPLVVGDHLIDESRMGGGWSPNRVSIDTRGLPHPPDLSLAGETLENPPTVGTTCTDPTHLCTNCGAPTPATEPLCLGCETKGRAL